MVSSWATGTSFTFISSLAELVQPLPSVKVYVIVCDPTPVAAGSKLNVEPLPSSVTPVPEYTPPTGVPPPSPF